ncbi:resolvase protein, partial [mine drainage metagenome]
LEAMIDYVRSGDTVVVHSMDRLARNLDDLRNIVQTLTSRGVRIEFVKESLTFVGDDSLWPYSSYLLWEPLLNLNDPLSKSVRGKELP